MSWEYKAARDVHKCVKPTVIASDVETGDIWKCDDCYRRYQVTKHLGDQREPGNWYTWDELTPDGRVMR